MRHAEVACGPDPRFRFDLAARIGGDGDRVRGRRSRQAPPSMATPRASGGGVSLRLRERHPRDASPGDARARRARGRPRDVQRRRVLVRASSDERRSLSTLPHDGTKGQTWQQAVQYVEEFEVRPGDRLPLVAKHDTYGVSFEVNDATFPRAERRTGEPLFDPAGRRPESARKGRTGVGARRRAIAARVSSGGGDGGRRGRATRGLWIGRLRGCRLVREDDGVRRGEARAEGKGWKIERRRYTRKTRLG